MSYVCCDIFTLCFLRALVYDTLFPMYITHDGTAELRLISAMVVLYEQKDDCSDVCLCETSSPNCLPAITIVETIQQHTAHCPKPYHNCAPTSQPYICEK